MRKPIVLCGVVLSVFSLATLNAARAEETPAIETPLQKIHESWVARQVQIESAIVKWTEHHVDFPDGLSRSLSSNSDDWVPATKSEYSGQYELKLKDDLSIYRYVGKQMLLREPAKSSEYLPFKSIEAFNGQQGRSLRMLTDSDEVPVGIIHMEDLNPDARRAGHTPLAWYCRPTDFGMGGFRLHQLDLVADHVDRHGIECTVLSDESFAPNTHVWVAPGLDYNVVGVEKKAGRKTNKNVWEIWVDYEKNSESIYVPKSWVFDASAFDGRRLWQSRCEIHEFRLNVPIAEEDFDFSFPPKTLVHDLKKGKQYLVHPGGSMSELSPTAVGRTYEELLSSSSQSK